MGGPVFGSHRVRRFRPRWPRARLTGGVVDMGGPAPPPRSRGLVGRGREVAELVAGLEDAISGRGRLFLVAGAPGIGKTRLAEHLAGLAAERGGRGLWGGCWGGGGDPPFLRWRE